MIEDFLATRSLSDSKIRDYRKFLTVGEELRSELGLEISQVTESFYQAYVERRQSMARGGKSLSEGNVQKSLNLLKAYYKYELDKERNILMINENEIEVVGQETLQSESETPSPEAEVANQEVALETEGFSELSEAKKKPEATLNTESEPQATDSRAEVMHETQVKSSKRGRPRIDKAGEEKRSVKITYYLTPQYFKQLETYCTLKGCGIASQTAKVIEDFLLSKKDTLDKILELQGDL